MSVYAARASGHKGRQRNAAWPVQHWRDGRARESIVELRQEWALETWPSESILDAFQITRRALSSYFNAAGHSLAGNPAVIHVESRNGRNDA